MQIIEYFEDGQKEHWIKEIEGFSWGAAKYLAKLLRENSFEDTLGKNGKLFLLIDGEDLVVLGVANPKTDGYPYNQDGTQEEVEKFLTDNGYTFPVVMDTTGEIFNQYGIRSFPTTFMIDKDGNVFGYVSGALSADMMESVVSQTMSGKRTQ